MCLIFLNYLINVTILEKKILNIKYVFIFPKTFVGKFVIVLEAFSEVSS